MKNVIVLLSALFFLFLNPTTPQAFENSACIQENGALKTSQSIDCQESQQQTFPVKDNYCNTLWAIQPLFEKFVIPVTLGLAIANDQTCAYHALAITFDLTFWMILACACNEDQAGCITWTIDFIYNTVSYNNLCR